MVEHRTDALLDIAGDLGGRLSGRRNPIQEEVIEMAIGSDRGHGDGFREPEDGDLDDIADGQAVGAGIVRHEILGWQCRGDGG